MWACQLGVGVHVGCAGDRGSADSKKRRLAEESCAGHYWLMLCSTVTERRQRDEGREQGQEGLWGVGVSKL